MEHTCSYYCERPECIRAQRDELRDRLEKVDQGGAVAWTLAWNGKCNPMTTFSTKERAEEYMAGCVNINNNITIYV